MLHALLAPLCVGVNSNPGSLLIEQSIRWLIRRADPEAKFFPVSLMAPDPEGWRMVREQASTVIWCGNPRFNTAEEGQYCDFGVWEPLRQAIDAGATFIDAWAGAAYPYEPSHTFEARYARLAANKKNLAILSWEAKASLAIARDRLTEHLLARHAKTVRLPCSTWFAHRYWHIEPEPKTHHAIILRRLPSYPQAIRIALAVRSAMAAEGKPVVLAAHTAADIHWCRRHGCTDPVFLLCDPETLLRFLAVTDKLLSWRIHASVPALSLEAQVANVEIDSRADVLDEFGVPSLPLDFLPEQVVFHRPQRVPNEQQIVGILRDHLRPQAQEGK